MIYKASLKVKAWKGLELVLSRMCVITYASLNKDFSAFIEFIRVWDLILEFQKICSN